MMDALEHILDFLGAEVGDKVQNCWNSDGLELLQSSRSKLKDSRCELQGKNRAFRQQYWKTVIQNCAVVSRLQVQDELDCLASAWGPLA